MRARVVFRALRVVACTVGYAGLGSLRPREARAGLRKRWAQATLRSLGVKVSLLGKDTEELLSRTWEGPTLVLANHRSALDIPVLLSIFGGVFLSRHDLERWPLIGPAAHVGGTIFVERGNVKSARKAVDTMRQCLRSGATLIMFPEGGTFEGDEVRPMRRGAFQATDSLHLAPGRQLRIVPVGLAYDRGTEFIEESFADHALQLGQRKKNRVTVSVGEAIPVEGNQPVSMEYVRSQIQNLVHQARDAHRP